MTMKSLPDGLAHRAHRLDREPAPLLGAATPRVDPLVGARREELVDQVALGPHDLDAVVAGLAGQPGGPGEGADLPPHAAVGEGAGRELRDRALHRRRRHAPRGVRVAPRVQDLQRDPPTRLVHGIRHLAVLAGLAPGRQLRRHRVERALEVRREAAGDDQPGSPTGPLGEVGGELGEVARVVLEAGVHRAHDHPVRQRHVAQVQRRQQVGVVAHRPSSSSVSGRVLRRSR